VTNPADRALVFSWAVQRDNGHGLKVDPVSKKSRQLTIMKKTMQARYTYAFAFTAVSANNADLSSTSVAEVYVEPDVVVAKIAGGASRIIGLMCVECVGRVDECVGRVDDLPPAALAACSRCV
jgi:hypothetical protein